MKVGVLSTSGNGTIKGFLWKLDQAGVNVDCVLNEVDSRVRISEVERRLSKNHFSYKRLVLWKSPSYWVNLLVNKCKRLLYKEVKTEHLKTHFIDVLRHSSEETMKVIVSRELDVIILHSSNWLIKQNLISLGVPIVNVHNALLPDYRGLDGLFWSLYYSNDKGHYTMTAHIVDKGIDTGPIICKKTFEIDKFSSLLELRTRSFDNKIELFVKAISVLEEAQDKLLKQDDKGLNRGPMPLEMLISLHHTLVEKNR